MRVGLSLLSNRRSLIFAAFAAAASAFAAYFIGQEKTVYYWDYVTYWQKVTETAETLKACPLYPIFKLFYSVRMSDYNDFPAWPPVLFNFVFGPGRLSYILSIVNIYAVPAGICFVWLSLRRRPGLADTPFSELITGALVVLLNPFIWDPLLSGYLDIGGLLFANLALGFFWLRPLSEPRTIRSLASMALMLVLMVLFRRWYVFWVVSFFILTGFLMAIQTFRPRDESMRWTYFKNYFLLAFLFVAIFSLIAWPLPLKFIKTDYSNMYSAYSSMKGSQGLWGILSNTFAHFGYFHVSWALLGFYFAIAAKGPARARAFFVMAQTCLIFLLFSRVQDFGLHHYYLLLQGILLFQIDLVLHARGLFYKGLVIVLAFVCFGAVFLPWTRPLADSLLPVTPARRHAPQVRHDRGEIRRLIEFIRAQGLGPSDRVYVLASSFLFNSDTLKWAERSMPVETPIGRAVLRTHSVDKVDGFPESLFGAKYVVVGDPIQYHLQKKDQLVVGIPAESILNREGIGLHYTELPGQFRLDGNVRLRIFRRNDVIPESETKQMRAHFRRYYPDWSEEAPPLQVDGRRLWLEKVLGFSKFQDQKEKGLWEAGRAR